MRLPNGYGSVSKLTGNRRNPWRVRVTTGWTFDAVTKKAKQQYTTVGYYPTRQAALQALAAYNTNPYDLDAAKATFAEIYNKWSDSKFEKIGASNISGYKASYNACPSLHNMKFTDIKLSHLQNAINSSGKNPPTQKKIKTLFNKLFEYAAMNGVISKDENIVEYVEIGVIEQSTLHYRFTNKELETMWLWSNNEYVQVILMLIYSGVRPGELFNLKSEDVNLEEGFFSVLKGKTVNATRKVPIHNRTYPFFEHWKSKKTEYLITNLSGKRINFDTNHGAYMRSFFTPLLQDMGILHYKNERGELQDHLPDDTRHTFTTMWKEKKLDEAMRRKIQGHSGKGIGEIVYTHFDLELLKEELNKL